MKGPWKQNAGCDVLAQPYGGGQMRRCFGCEQKKDGVGGDGCVCCTARRRGGKRMQAPARRADTFGARLLVFSSAFFTFVSFFHLRVAAVVRAGVVHAALTLSLFPVARPCSWCGLRRPVGSSRQSAPLTQEWAWRRAPPPLLSAPQSTFTLSATAPTIGGPLPCAQALERSGHRRLSFLCIDVCANPPVVLCVCICASDALRFMGVRACVCVCVCPRACVLARAHRPRAFAPRSPSLGT